VEQDAVYRLATQTVGGVTVTDSHAQPYTTSAGSHVLKLFVCPTDPTTATNSITGTSDVNRDGYAVSSYRMNYLVFTNGGAELSASMPDGTSNQIMAGEAYKQCVDSTGTLTSYTQWSFSATAANAETTNASIFWWDSPSYNTPNYTPTGGMSTQSGPSSGTVAVPVLFQVQPPKGTCDRTKLQTSHPGGMQVLLGDGSVRGLSPNISGTTWAEANIPDDGNALGGDW
jgi:prepilin-type processing-associated H-X9-DG protein